MFHYLTFTSRNNILKKLEKVNISKILPRAISDHVPRRALLYVPGHDERKLTKAFNLNVDCIAMDCEDGVAVNRKTEARQLIRKILDEGKPNKSVRNYDLGVRVNGMDTKYFIEDLDVVLSAKTLPDTILVPKINDPEQIKMFADKASSYTKRNKINLIIYIESAKAIINLVDICKTALKMQETVNIIPVALVFGGDDFIADVGTAKSFDCHEILYARQKCVTTAKAFGLQAIDVVHIQFKELELLKSQSEQGARLGFTGKQVIHPDQVPVVQKAFLPNELQIKWAKELLVAFEEHQMKGKGAFEFKGSMIDMPTMKQAQNIINLLKMQ